MISDYKENLDLISEYQEHLFSYNHLEIEKRIQEIKLENEEITKEILVINLKISDYHTDVKITTTIDDDIRGFIKKCKVIMEMDDTSG